MVLAHGGGLPEALSVALPLLVVYVLYRLGQRRERTDKLRDLTTRGAEHDDDRRDPGAGRGADQA